jgi:hypothetical protein
MKPKPNRNAYILTVNPEDRKSGPLFRRKWLPLMLAHNRTNWSIAPNLAHSHPPIAPGALFLFLLQSRKRNGQRGVIGFGEILSAPDDGYYEATGEPALFVRIRSEVILNPFQEPNLILSREHLLSLGLAQFKFVRQSGTWIDYDIAKGVSDLFVAQLKLGRMLQQKTIKLAA